MKIEKLTIRYSTTVPIAAYGVNDKFDWEITVSPSKDGEAISMEEQTQELKKEGDAIVKKLYPHLHPEKERRVVFSEATPDSYDSKPIDKYHLDEPSQWVSAPPLEQQISEITDPKILESFRLLVKGKPHLQKLFDNKLKELNNNQK